MVNLSALHAICKASPTYLQYALNLLTSCQPLRRSWGPTAHWHVITAVPGARHLPTSYSYLCQILHYPKLRAFDQNFACVLNVLCITSSLISLRQYTNILKEYKCFIASVVYCSEFLATDPEVPGSIAALPEFLRSRGSRAGSTQPREYS
jgi:hypothetical protein